MWMTALATLTLLLNAMPEPLLAYLKAGRAHNLDPALCPLQLGHSEYHVQSKSSSERPTRPSAV